MHQILDHVLLVCTQGKLKQVVGLVHTNRGILIMNLASMLGGWGKHNEILLEYLSKLEPCVMRMRPGISFLYRGYDL